jgi:hypothetical protein
MALAVAEEGTTPAGQAEHPLGLDWEAVLVKREAPMVKKELVLAVVEALALVVRTGEVPEPEGLVLSYFRGGQFSRRSESPSLPE